MTVFPSQPAGRIPLWVKWLYTGFVAILVPYYLHCYGPTNFLYYCDVAVLMALVAVWREDPLLGFDARRRPSSLPRPSGWSIFSVACSGCTSSA